MDRPTRDEARWDVPDVAQIRDKFPGYELISAIGHGGMGAVYTAQQQSLERMVAIKILRPLPDDHPSQAASRFEYEARTLAQLNHPNIVKVFDFGKTDRGEFFIVMEYVEGTNLSRSIQHTGQLSVGDALTILSQVCKALDYAHSKSVIHRDIKPANILMAADGRIKIADFGLAKLARDPRRPGFTTMDVSMGTPEYTAPEGAVSCMEVDARGDLFSVGVMFYEMLTGKVPRGLFKLPSEIVNGLDPRLDAFVCEAMEPEPEDRFQSAREALTMIREIHDRSFENATETVPSRKRQMAIGVTVAVSLIVLSLLIWINAPFSESGFANPSNVQNLPDSHWKNLLVDVNVQTHSKMDEWRIQGGELISPFDSISHQTIELPLANPPTNYDLRVELTRNDGEAAIVVGFRYHETGGFVMLDSWSGEGKIYNASIGEFGGRSRQKTRKVSAEGLRLEPGIPHELIVNVRDQSVKVMFDDEPLLEWVADWKRITQHEGYFFQKALEERPFFAVGSCNSEVVFHQVEIRAVPAATTTSSGGAR